MERHRLSIENLIEKEKSKMTKEQLMKNLECPKHPVDVVLDTDAYNEIDDQFAIAYLIKNSDKLNTKAIYAAPFHNEKSKGPKDGMEKSYNEIKKVLDLLDTTVDVFKGSDRYLLDENTYVDSPAVQDLVKRAKAYSPENPLYVVAIGAITNVASALIVDPTISDNVVIVWLGGHGYHYHDTKEFNMIQDVAATRVVMKSNAPFVQLACNGVVSEFRISASGLNEWLVGKNNISDYLAKNTISEAETYAAGKPWTRVIWDVTAVAWLLNEDSKFMETRIIKTRLPEYNGVYSSTELEHEMRYVYYKKRDNLAEDMIKKLVR